MSDTIDETSLLVCYVQVQSDLEDAIMQVQILQARLEILAKVTTKTKKRIEQIQSLNKRLYSLLKSTQEKKQALISQYCPNSLEPEDEPAEYGLMLKGVDDARRSYQSSSTDTDEDSNNVTLSTSSDRRSLHTTEKSVQSLTLHDSNQMENLSKTFSVTREDIKRISRDFDEAHSSKLQKAFEKLLIRKIGEAENLDIPTPEACTPTTDDNLSNTDPATVAVATVTSTSSTAKMKRGQKTSNLSANSDVNDVD